MELKSYLAEKAKRVDQAIDGFLPKAKTKPATIHGAMRYSVFAGGKRLRPIFCIAAAEACGGDPENALPPACAVELMHTYSLVHDDLPAMDDDDLRRGRPTCHKVYGEGIAVLCGDALLTEAFLVLAQTEPTKRYTARDYVSELALTGGSRHLIGGQVMDLEGEGKALSKRDLVKIHEAKTAALLTSSLRLGAMTANATPAKLDALTTFGHALGLAFQVIDDILDVTQSTEILGKTAGKDEAVEKSTYPSLLGLEASRKEAARLTKKAMTALDSFGKKGDRLREMADNLLRREF
ncbi:polyprenyl synthetase family protein [Luteolibacter pohnpeiensis]|uniref:Polyprenyl synthetase family protein n=1 Tax=Luteolibacter pohnpeiensis TaxID=454153 RepID=A0A934SEY7_9BACT|nr:farnesyl diphosphate synthase [Luteolibacter pohnpeiensis]MBK1883953.1 polyprenyl synthetase family protein [Luteolibacter pohnpeiensis]